jgi:hypothetical protein
MNLGAVTKHLCIYIKPGFVTAPYAKTGIYD